MSNKLEALSQPIGWTDEISANHMKEGYAYGYFYEKNHFSPTLTIPLYSHECVTALVDENEYLRMRFKESDLAFGRMLLAMRAAVIETAHGGGLAAGMNWIVNALEGPGEFAPKDELDAQAYYDRESKKIDLELIKCMEYFTARNEAKKLVAGESTGGKS